MKRILWALTVALLPACQPTPQLQPGASEPRGPGTGRECAATCNHWAEMTEWDDVKKEFVPCEESKPSPVKGVTCEDRCRGIEEFEALPHACIQAATTCEESRACEE